MVSRFYEAANFFVPVDDDANLLVVFDFTLGTVFGMLWSAARGDAITYLMM